MQQLIARDGGKGQFTEITPGMLGIFNTLLKVGPAGMAAQLATAAALFSAPQQAAGQHPYHVRTGLAWQCECSPMWPAASTVHWPMPCHKYPASSATLGCTLDTLQLRSACIAKGEADATWVFMPWEGVEAQRRGVELNAFSLSDSGIPYGYSPVVVATAGFLK